MVWKLPIKLDVNAVIMLLFCPLCGNLMVAQMYIGEIRFICRTCPVTKRITRTKISKTYYKLKVRFLVVLCLVLFAVIAVQ